MEREIEKRDSIRSRGWGKTRKEFPICGMRGLSLFIDIDDRIDLTAIAK
jgi:hypothetical protein